MMKTLSRFAVAAALAAITSGCALSLRNPDIADLRDHPGRYQDHTVTVNGVVTSSWGLPLVPFRFYKVDDGTGEVTILSESSRMPSNTDRRSGACAAACSCARAPASTRSGRARRTPASISP